MSNLNSHLSYRPDIDGLRAIAVLAVVFYHAFPSLAQGGFVGVDIFFVISGYLISTILLKGMEQGSFSFADFYARRIKRIFPALMLVLLSCLAFGWFALLADEYKQLGKHTAAGAAFVSNLVLWKEDSYFDVVAELKPLLHLWSLGIEEQFYIIWPTLLFVAFSLRLNLLVFTVVITLISFAFNVLRIKSFPVGTFYLMPMRLFELQIGSILAYLTLRGKFGFDSVVNRIDAKKFSQSERLLENVKAFVGACLIATAIYGLNKETLFPGYWALLPTIGGFLLISSREAWLNRKILASRALVLIGLISYPLYLWHWPLLSFATIVESGTPKVEIRIAAVVLSLVLAGLTYKWIEKPVRSMQHLKSTIFLSGTSAIIGFLGYIVYQDGITSRNIQAYYSRIQVDFDLAKKGRESAIRAPFCHLNDRKESFEEYKLTIDQCLSIDHHRKNILVMGDSTAADLWLALTSAYKNINFLQATGAGCMPIENGNKIKCNALTRYIKYDFKELRKVDGIIFACRWGENFKSVQREIEYYKKLGIQTAIFGPIFEFTTEIDKIMARIYQFNLDPNLSKFLNLKTFDLDREMEGFFRQKQIPYASRIEPLCRNNTCPVFDSNNVLLILDYGHWTDNGAKYFGSILFKKQLLEGLFSFV
jgi:peptidoglycan/LPS O-acetylase OafA/YrhL